LFSSLAECDHAYVHAGVTFLWGFVPQVPGFAEPQWQAFLAVFRAQEEHMLHLIQPVWSESFPLLWQNTSSEVVASQSSSSSSSSSGFDGMAGLVRWCSVLLLRAAFHSK
jgi:hypothetical protein